MDNPDLKFPVSTGDHTSGEMFAFQCLLEVLLIDGMDVNAPSIVRSIAEVAFDAGLQAAKWEAQL